jgi:hypothetical protein
MVVDAPAQMKFSRRGGDVTEAACRARAVGAEWPIMSFRSTHGF